MKALRHAHPLLAAFVAAGIATSGPAHAVRLNPDGHGQALIYPYYTARSAPSARVENVVNAYVSAFSVINISSGPKVVKARFFEGKAGAEVYEFNLFLSAYDVWAAGIVSAGAGAGLFTRDHSCTTPAISRNPSSPTPFRNAAYASDPLGDSLDRTYEGYFEFLEMGAIDPDSALGLSVTQVPDYSASNASTPPCNNLPATNALPSGLLKPTGGLVGSISYINVNEGTDYSVDAIALSQWSDKAQWSPVGNGHPNLSDASPPVSFVADSQAAGDALYITNWATGRDAVSAVFMVDHVVNDYNVEPLIGAATQWVMTMPTKPFHVSTASVERPFQSKLAAQGSCDAVGEKNDTTGVDPMPFDREGQAGPSCFYFNCFGGAPLCATANVGTFAYQSTRSAPLESRNHQLMDLFSIFINGYANLQVRHDLPEMHVMVAPAGATSVIPLDGSPARAGATVTYFGLPIVGFAVESYTNGSVRVGGSTVLSNYGGQFNHKFTRRIEVAP